MIAVLVVAIVLGKVGTDAVTRDSTSNLPQTDSVSLQDEPSTSEHNGTALKDLCRGTLKAIPAAAPWTPGKPAVVANIAFDTNDVPNDWSPVDDFFITEPLRAGVRTDVSLTKVSLVLCRGRGAHQAKNTCDYVVNNDAAATATEVRSWKRDVRLYEARTGRLLGHEEWAHDVIKCEDVVISYDDGTNKGIDFYPRPDRLGTVLETWTRP